MHMGLFEIWINCQRLKIPAKHQHFWLSLEKKIRKCCHICIPMESGRGGPFRQSTLTLAVSFPTLYLMPFHALLLRGPTDTKYAIPGTLHVYNTHVRTGLTRIRYWRESSQLQCFNNVWSQGLLSFILEKKKDKNLRGKQFRLISPLLPNS